MSALKYNSIKNERIKDSVKNTMEINVALVDVSVDGVNAISKTEE